MVAALYDLKLLGRDHKGRAFRTRFFCFAKFLKYLTFNDCPLVIYQMLQGTKQKRAQTMLQSLTRPRPILQSKNPKIYTNPARFNKASGFGSCPRKRLYKIIGASVPPLERTLSLNFVATSVSKMPFSLK